MPNFGKFSGHFIHKDETYIYIFEHKPITIYAFTPPGEMNSEMNFHETSQDSYGTPCETRL